MDIWESYYNGLQDDLDQETYDKILTYAFNLYERYRGDQDVSCKGVLLTAIEEQGDTIKRVSDRDFNRLLKDLERNK